MRRKKLTREQYAEKFNRLFNEYNYILQENEQIIQCNEKYPPYWFISNYAYLFSIVGNSIKILKPNYRNTGSGKDGSDWYYTYIDTTGKKRKVSQHILVAQHFLTNEFEDIDNDRVEVHHIKTRNSFNPNQPQLCNRASNLQILPKDIHQRLTNYSHKTAEQLNKEIEKKVTKANVPTYRTINLEELVASVLNNNNGIAYMKSNGQTVAKPIKAGTIKFVPNEK